METSIIESPFLPVSLSDWQLRVIPTRIRRLRRVAHQPSRAYSMVLIWQNAQKVRDYWNNLIKTDIEE